VRLPKRSIHLIGNLRPTGSYIHQFAFRHRGELAADALALSPVLDEHNSGSHDRNDRPKSRDLVMGGCNHGGLQGTPDVAKSY
jgi:hypothetical protein